jgi:sugar lactone lactonase YvrE
MSTTMRARPFTDVCANHGEGPVWDAVGKRLLCVDMLAGAVIEVATDGSTARHELADVVAVVRPRRQGGFVAGIDRGFALLDDDLSMQRRLPDVWTDRSIRMNEGGCDPAGRFFAGSMDYESAPKRGALYRLDPDLSVHTVLTGVTISNGLEWSADGGTAYYVDTPTHGVDAIDFDAATGAFGARHTAVAIDPADGNPDGLTVDDEGCLWVALWGGSAVRRYRPTGELLATVELPVSQVTACAFGGDELATLFITTSADGSDEADAGRVYSCEPGVRGRPVTPFAG